MLIHSYTSNGLDLINQESTCTLHSHSQHGEYKSMKKFFQMKVMLENLGSHIVSNVDLWESGLCSRSNQAPQATNFYLKATGKDLNIYFSYNLKCWAPRISGLGKLRLLIIFLGPQPWNLRCFSSKL